ncbi:MAG: hypothetical protein ABI565_06720 [Vicinamibacteria bacterium]
MNRRSWLQTVATLAGALHLGRIRAWAQAASFPQGQTGTLRAMGEAALPESLGPEGRERVVTDFTVWLRDWKEGADRDHGYGFTRIVRTGPSPASRYVAQIEALDAAAKTRGGAFATVPLADRRILLSEAIAQAKIDRLPDRPNGGHIATDLMAFFFGSTEANDLCYRAAIGKDTCRGLAESDQPPQPLEASAAR